jgi:hypothetical protein
VGARHHCGRSFSVCEVAKAADQAIDGRDQNLIAG